MPCNELGAARFEIGSFTSKGISMSVYCSQCGVVVTDESKFCFKCGGAIHKGIPPASGPNQALMQSNQLTQNVAEPAMPMRVPEVTVTATSTNVVAVDPSDQIQTVIASKIGISKWWPIFATFAFFLCAAILQNKRLYPTSSLGERLIFILSVALIYTAIGAIYFARSKKITPLTPWEAEARCLAANWYLFVAVALSSMLSVFYSLSGSTEGDVVQRAITFILIGIIFGVGWAAWRGQAWAFVALFVWEFGGVIFGGALDPFGLFIVVFSVQAYRYYRAAKQFAAMKLPNLLGSLSGLTKLTYAAAQARLYYVKHLVKSGANVDERTTTGFTPLMLAAATNKSPAVVKHLLKAGADKTMQTPDGRQAVDFARERGASKIVSLLTV